MARRRSGGRATGAGLSLPPDLGAYRQ